MFEGHYFVHQKSVPIKNVTVVNAFFVDVFMLSLVLEALNVLLSNKKSLELALMPKLELGIRNWTHQLGRKLGILNMPRSAEEITNRKWNVRLRLR